MEALRFLSWDVVALLLGLVLVALALRRWAGASGARIGAGLVWLVFLATAAWAAATMYRAMAVMVH